ncbi:DUF5994 family protein [Crossiella sp. CA198]|uniref:DUF5994 family protein n=1 Tax=Crossiella sp. CA198 TaxID=3455607 RepID=UPI003F8D6DC2
MRSDLSHHSPLTPSAARRALRLRLKPRESAVGLLDGGWWPHTGCLAVELPPLLELLAVRLGPIGRVVFNPEAFRPAPRRVLAGGWPVVLRRSATLDPAMVLVLGRAGGGLRLLVVPPSVAEEAGRRVLLRAAGRENIDSPAELLAPRAWLRLVVPRQRQG